MTRGIRFVSESPETVFAPVWDYSIAIKPIVINTEDIAKIVLQKEKEIIDKYSGDDDGNTGLGVDSLTARFKHYNVLKWQEVVIAQLHQEIRIFHDEYFAQVIGSEPPPLKVRCWANVMRKGQQIKKHTHSTHPHSYLGGHFCVTAENTSTSYMHPYTQEDYVVENKPGEITLFPNYLTHYTSVHESDVPRISIAFDLVTYKNLVHVDDDNLVIL
tara:strand:+ start:1162 stop:1806 length:645 start_codon:yes stop_codon:yes gene_type:complete